MEIVEVNSANMDETAILIKNGSLVTQDRV